MNFTIRNQFPLLTNARVNGKPLVYADNGATTQKPQCVLDSISELYQHYYSNVHRGGHALASISTERYEQARTIIAQWMNVPQGESILFTAGTTAGLNLLAHCLQGIVITPGSTVVVTQMEHHANIVPWQMACNNVGATIIIAPLNADGSLDLPALRGLVQTRPALLAITHVSNTTGVINAIEEICALAGSHGVCTVVDGAQAVAHGMCDVQRINCDAYVWSGHKLFAPTGIGVLYAKPRLLESMPPYMGGGAMINTVELPSGTTFATGIQRFEAGTPNIEAAIALARAVEWFSETFTNEVEEHDRALSERLIEQLHTVDGLRILGSHPSRVATCSFVHEAAHAHDIGTLLDQQGVAVRVGHHCTQPLMKFFGVTSSVRISLSLYNTFDEIDAIVNAINKSIEVLA
jgi:cysteine desulfurase / selenocysteine lyase